MIILTNALDLFLERGEYTQVFYIHVSYHTYICNTRMYERKNNEWNQILNKNTVRSDLYFVYVVLRNSYIRCIFFSPSRVFHTGHDETAVTTTIYPRVLFLFVPSSCIQVYIIYIRASQTLVLSPVVRGCEASVGRCIYAATAVSYHTRNVPTIRRERLHRTLRHPMFTCYILHRLGRILYYRVVTLASCDTLFEIESVSPSHVAVAKSFREGLRARSVLYGGTAVFMYKHLLILLL